MVKRRTGGYGGGGGGDCQASSLLQLQRESQTPSAACVNTSASEVRHRQTQGVNEKSEKEKAILPALRFFPSGGTSVENVSFEARRGSERSAARSINQKERERKRLRGGGGGENTKAN